MKTNYQATPLESELLCASAQRRTGLTDFGSPPIKPGLAALTNSLEHEGNLHRLGRFLIRNHLLGLLETRLRLHELWREQSETAQASPLRGPVFITGMPRSGSTFLHELLMQDPDLRAPRVWEVMLPVSAAKPDRGWHDPRPWRAATCLWCFRLLAPKADQVHPMRARTPHECAAIQSYTLLSHEFVATCRVPSYEAFLRASDFRPVYQWQKRFLQHLEPANSCKRWVLKSPDHAFGLEALFSVFPDALIIQTHRDPLEVIRSLVELNEVLRSLFSRSQDRDELAEREAQSLAEAMDCFIRFRDAHPELAGRFADVDYRQLVADPLEVVRRVYRQFGMTLSDIAAQQMRALALRRVRYRGRRSKRSILTLSDLGLDAPAEAGRFAHYCRRFGIACSQLGVR